MKHYIRDLDLSSYSVDRDAGMCAASFAIYHFLRNSGWEWQWECDGQLNSPGHCPDGNMEDSGTTSWTLGSTGVLSKDTDIQLTSFFPSLKWVSAAAGGETLTSSNFTAMTDGRVYQQVIWFYNDSGQTFTFDVFDGSSFGSSVNLVSNGEWTSYRITFTKNAAGSSYFRITAPAVASYTAYMNACMTFESFFEYNTSALLADYSDGQVLSSNQFNSASYTFSASDVGKHVVIWDEGNLGNSGVYAISSESGGVVTLNIRAGGAETLATATGLKWRLIDLAQAPKTEVTSTNESGCGWGLKNPRSENQQLFMRHKADGGNGVYKYVAFWAAPDDRACFDPLTGQFRKQVGIVSSRDYCPDFDWSKPNGGQVYVWFFLYSNVAKPGGRLYFMTDDDGTFTTVYLRTGLVEQGFYLTGYMGDKPDMSKMETWWHAGARYAWTPRNFATPEIEVEAAFSRGLSTVTGEVDGVDLATSTRMAIWGTYDYSKVPIALTNAKANPFGGDEWIQPLFCVKNWSNNASIQHQEMQCDVGIFWARQNLTDYTTFDSNSYFKFLEGMTWEWPGISVIA